jgi:hypothetical protein
MMLSGVSRANAKDLRLDVWDRVEIYMIYTQLLARKLKIISSVNLKLIIYFLVYSYYYFHPSSRYHLLPRLGTLHLTSHVYLRLAKRPSSGGVDDGCGQPTKAPTSGQRRALFMGVEVSILSTRFFCWRGSHTRPLESSRCRFYCW